MSDRRRLALPVDVARVFDITVPQTQIDNDTFLSESVDNADALSGLVNDAADEFRLLTDDTISVSRAGVAGQRETYETQTYRLPGHQQYRARFSNFTFDYDFDERVLNLEHENILPFDPAEGDEVLIYRGLRADDRYEDLTADEGDAWFIVDNVRGQIAISPTEILRSMFGSVRRGVQQGIGQDKLRIAVSYRYGGLGGDRGRATETDLDVSLTASETGSVAVTDGAGFPVRDGDIVVRIDDEYLLVEPSPASDSMNIVERGVRGTTGASHDSGATVHYTPPAIRKAVAARAGQMLIDSRRYRGYLPDTEDDLDMGDVHSNLGAVWDGTIRALGGGGGSE